MKKFRILPLALGLTLFTLNSCQKDIDTINQENPNQFSNADGSLMITGAQMANVLFQEGEAARMAGIFSGYFTGYDRQYISYQQYKMTAGDFDNIWGTLYAEGIAQCKIIKEKATASGNTELYGAAAITEAHLLLTASGLFGDIPASEACNDEILEPKFDKMSDVHNYCIGLLDEVIPSMTGSSAYGDAYVAGFDWGQVASTLKARALLRNKDYAGAAAAAANGVQMNMDLKADHTQETPGAWNLYFDFLYWNRGGYLSCDGAYIVGMLTDSIDDGTGTMVVNPQGRINDKTQEMGRYDYYFLPDYYTSLDPNMFGIFYASSHYDLVTYVENELILAECAARTSDDATALTHLNNVRDYNNNMFGGFAAYDIADFGPGAMVDGATASDALLQEIMMEKYVSLFGQCETFNDVRRTGNAQGVPVNIGDKLPARYLIPQSEINARKNVLIPSEGTDLFAPLEYYQ
jgi:hypothetical protein